MAQGPYGIDPGSGGFTLEPQGMPVQNFFRQGGWGPQVPFGPAHGFGPGPIPWQDPMYDTRDGWPMQGPANPMDDIAPPGECPQPCPTTVRADLCFPQPRVGRQAWGPSDPFGDPAEFIPPGVRTIPEYTPNGVKSVPGGPALVGPGGQFVFPTPKLPSTPRGTAVPAGEVVGSPGAIDAGRPLERPAGVQTATRRGFRMPWWAWVVAGVAAWQVMGR